MKKSEQYIKILATGFKWPYFIPISNLLSITFSPLVVVLTYKNTNIGSLKNIALLFIPVPGYTLFEDAETLVPFYIAKALSTGVEVLDTDLAASVVPVYSYN